MKLLSRLFLSSVLFFFLASPVRAAATSAPTDIPTEAPTGAPAPTSSASQRETAILANRTWLQEIFVLLKERNYFGFAPLRLIDTALHMRDIGKILQPISGVSVVNWNPGPPELVTLQFGGDLEKDPGFYRAGWQVCEQLGQAGLDSLFVQVKNGPPIRCQIARSEYDRTGSVSYTYWPLSRKSDDEAQLFVDFNAAQSVSRAKAIEAGKKLVDAYPSAINLYDLGFFYFDIARTEYSGPAMEKALAESISYYRKALDADPNFAPAKSSLGNVLFEQSHKQNDESIQLYDEAIALDPHWTLAYLNKGATLSQIGQKKEGYEWVKKGILTNPKDPNIDYIKRMFVCIGREINAREDALFYEASGVNPKETVSFCPFPYRP